MPDSPQPDAGDIGLLRRLLGDPDGSTWLDGALTAALLDNAFQEGGPKTSSVFGYSEPVVNGFDTYGAAADLLDAEVVSLRRKFDTTDASGAVMKRQQMVANAERAADRMRQRARVRTTATGRSDMWPAFGRNGYGGGYGPC